MLPAVLKTIADTQPYPLLFVTVSGAHLYGFPSPDSDYDLRGVHMLPLDRVVGFKNGPETIETTGDRDGIELDLVTHDVHKFFSLLLKKNGYVLEQLYSPLVVMTTPYHERLKEIARGCITRHHAHHYFGFAETQWKLFDKERPRRIKPLLYIYRVLLTGIHLMRTGKIEANLVTLNDEQKLTHVADLMAKKVTTAEQTTLADGEIEFHQREYDRLREELQRAQDGSALPENPSCKAELHNLLLQIRLPRT